MALKLKITKAEYDALDAVIKPHYVAKDDDYVLEGFVAADDYKTSQSKINEFRTNNVNLLQQVETLKAEVEKFKDVDPVKYREYKEQIEALEKKGVKKPSDMELAIAAALKPLQDQLTAEKTAREKAEGESRSSRFRERIGAIATAKGVRAGAAMKLVLAEAENFFELKDGEVVAKPGKLSPTGDGVSPLTTDEWLGQMARSDEHSYLFEPTKGAGAPGGSGTGVGNSNNGPVRKLINPTPAEMGRNMKDIASGKVVVEKTA